MTPGETAYEAYRASSPAGAASWASLNNYAQAAWEAAAVAVTADLRAIVEPLKVFCVECAADMDDRISPGLKEKATAALAVAEKAREEAT